MRVPVSGGAGYIGSHTPKVLVHSGFEPIVLDNLSTGHRWAVKWGPLIERDLGDSTLIRKVIKTHKVQAVVHFAGFAYVGESMQRLRQYFLPILRVEVGIPQGAGDIPLAAYRTLTL